MKHLIITALAVLLTGAPAAAAPTPSNSEPARLGVMALPMSAQMRGTLGAQPDRGVLIADVVTGSIAAQAGMVVGDVLVSIDGKAVTTADDVRATLAAKHAGDKVTLAVVRGHAPRELTATVTMTPTAAAKEILDKVSLLAPLRALVRA